MSDTIRCPECQHILRVPGEMPPTLTCPHCYATIPTASGQAQGAPGGSEYAFGRGVPDLTRDVRTDRWMISIILWVLVGLLGAGVVGTYLLLPRGEEEWLMVAFGVLDLVVLAAIATPIWTYALSGGQTPGPVKVLGLVALTLGLGLAAFVFLFAVCLGMVLGH